MDFTVNNLASHLKSCRNRYMVSANNLANSDTNGFKKLVLIQTNDFKRTYIDTSRGAISRTDNSLDLALSEGCFFTVMTSRGNRFTSCGNFTLDERRRLVTQKGEPVLDAGGNTITIKGEPVITEDGNVYSGNEKVAKLAVVKPENRFNMISERGGFLKFNPVAASGGEFTVKSGYLEKSNVDPLQEMTAVIEILREFELTQRILKINQSISEKSAVEIGNTSR